LTNYKKQQKMIKYFPFWEKYLQKALDKKGKQVYNGGVELRDNNFE